jgi:arylsulfate sulfotransferase
MKNLFIVIFFLLFIFAACRDIGDTSVTYHQNNLLLPVITFTSDKDINAIVEYWPSANTSSVQQSKESVGPDHSVILYNILPGTTYNYQIRDVEDGSLSDVNEFTTAQLPDAVIKIKKATIDSTAFDGFILMRKFSSPAADILLNNNGDVVWYNQYDTAVGRAFFWTNRKTILSTYDTSRILETKLSGGKLLDMDVRSRFPELNIHHDILYDKDGNIVTISTNCLPEGQDKIKSLKGIAVCGDGIIRLKPEGTIDWKWSILDDPDLKLPDNVKLRGKEAIGHANAIAIAQDGNYLISMRDFSQIWKINSQTGKLMWKLGKNGDFKMPKGSYFLRQHSVHVNSSGDIMMFDNGEKSERPLSRIVSFKLDEEKMEAIPQIMITLPKDLSSPKMCSAYNITDDKFLVCTSRDNASISVVDKSGATLWRINTNESSYRAYYVPNPFDDK